MGDIARMDERSGPSGRNEKPIASRPHSRRSGQDIVQGVRRQREHLMKLDGVDPLRGGVAD